MTPVFFNSHAIDVPIVFSLLHFVFLSLVFHLRTFCFVKNVFISRHDFNRKKFSSRKIFILSIDNCVFFFHRVHAIENSRSSLEHRAFIVTFCVWSSRLEISLVISYPRVLLVVTKKKNNEALRIESRKQWSRESHVSSFGIDDSVGRANWE